MLPKIKINFYDPDEVFALLDWFLQTKGFDCPEFSQTYFHAKTEWGDDKRFKKFVRKANRVKRKIEGKNKMFEFYYLFW